MARNDKKSQIKLLHSIDSFGIKKVSLSGIRIERLEDRVAPAVPFPHKHDFYQLMLVTKGTGWHRIDFKRYKVTAGRIFMMKPGQMHTWELKKGIKGYIVEFSSQSLNSIRESSRLINDFNLSPDSFTFSKREDYQEVLKLTEVMLEEFSKKREMHDLSLQGYLTSYIILLLRSYQTHPHQPKAVTTIEKLKDLIEKNFKEAHGVEFYAKELKTSSKALTMQLTRSIGKPPRQLIQERILLEAKRFLAFSHLSIAEIGYDLGFDDANYFGRFFRKHEKKTPAQFRKELLLGSPTT